MPRVKLNESITVTLNGSGNGQAQIGPLSARERWYPSNVAVSCLTHVLESSCLMYVGRDTTQSCFRDKSVLGSSGDTSGACSGDTMTCGDYVWAVWAGADANVHATLTVTGTKDV